MGLYLNPGNNVLLADMRQEIYIDKSMVMTELNQVFGSSLSRICVSRPRRFGKTMLANLIAAYYSRGKDMRAVFEKLQIAQTPNWDQHLNKYDVIKIDVQEFWNDARTPDEVIPYLEKTVVGELKDAYPTYISGGETLPQAIKAVYSKTQMPFVVILDEYDVLIRENVSPKVMDQFLKLLSGLFKSGGASEGIALAYITGILPIVRDRVQSKLNNFKERTMLSAGDFAQYIGFTRQEVRTLCERYGMDYKECLRWYDGYHLDGDVSVCNSNSVSEAMRAHRFADYWTLTGAYTAITDYIRYDFNDGLKEDVACLVGGGKVKVDITTFMNTLTDFSNKNDVLTCLIHLGYLTYDSADGTCQIPNGEIMIEWMNALRKREDYLPITQMATNSKRLIEATKSGDEAAVEQALSEAHRYVTSPETYNNEGALQSAVGLAYAFANTQYNIIKECAAGHGYADMAFLPFVKGVPAIIVELKMKKAPDVALRQIEDKHYADAVAAYHGDVVLVGISYDPDSKEHKCKIRKEVR